MAQQQSYQQAVTRYSGQLQQMFAPIADPALEGLAVAMDPAEILATRADDLATAGETLGKATIAFLSADSVEEREGAEMKLLTQVAADMEVAHALLSAALAEAEGRPALEAAPAAQLLRAQAAVESYAFAIAQPLEVGMTPFVFDGRYRDLPPMDATGAGRALQRDAMSSLERISRRAAGTTAQAGATLLRMDMETLREGVGLISSEIADLIDSVAADLRATVKRLLKSALRLILQAFDWVLALLGQDVETIARRTVLKWLDELKGPNGGINDDYVLRFIHRLYTPDVYTREIAAWIESSSAGMQTLVDTAEAVRSLAERYDKKTERVDKALRILAVLGMLPFSVVRVPQFQVALAAITLGLMGYVIFTGYDHSDSGSAYFLHRFRVPIPDRVTGVRRSIQEALGIVEPPLQAGLSEPPFGAVDEPEDEEQVPAPVIESADEVPWE